MTTLRPERDSGSAYGGAGDHGIEYDGQDRHAETPYSETPYAGPQQGEMPYGEASATEGAYTEGAYPAEAGSTEPVSTEPASTDALYTEAAAYEAAAQDAAPVFLPAVDDETVALRIPALDDETVALRIATPSPSSAESSEPSESSSTEATKPSDGSGGTPDGPAVTGGRAARRKAAKGRQGRQGRHGRHGARANAGTASADGAATTSETAGRPLSRVEARRAARASKPDVSVVVSRVIGETFITMGALMLLFVTYQLWWTNVQAHNSAGNEAHKLQNDWANGERAPGVFAPGQGFAILDLPTLDVVAPIAEGISKPKVLDRGMVGHYGEDSVPTAMPDAKTGNFGLAAHRNTHGEPFRYINRLKPGDPIVVETRDTYYVYKVTSMLPQTPPSNTSVLDPVPAGSGFTRPGRYITLTTCTPEFTSKYRLIVWGTLTEERPRDKGKPDALVE